MQANGEQAKYKSTLANLSEKETINITFLQEKGSRSCLTVTAPPIPDCSSGKVRITPRKGVETKWLCNNLNSIIIIIIIVIIIMVVVVLVIVISV